MGIDFVVLGEDYWYIQTTDGRTFYNLPAVLSERIEECNSNVTCLTLGPGYTYFVSFDDGSCLYNLPPDADEIVTQHLQVKDTIVAVSLGASDSWIVIFENSFACNKIPYELHTIITNAYICGVSVVDVSLGWDKDTYWVKLSNGTSQFIGPKDVILQDHQIIDNAVLGPSGTYFLDIRGENGGYWHNVSGAFDEVLYEARAAYVPSNEVRYLYDSISFSRGSGPCIYDTAKMVVQGEIAVTDLPRLQVVLDEEGRYWSLDSQTLWVLKAAGVNQIPVELIAPSTEFTELRDRAIARVDGDFQVTVS